MDIEKLRKKVRAEIVAKVKKRAGAVYEFPLCSPPMSSIVLFAASLVALVFYNHAEAFPVFIACISGSFGAYFYKFRKEVSKFYAPEITKALLQEPEHLLSALKKKADDKRSAFGKRTGLFELLNELAEKKTVICRNITETESQLQKTDAPAVLEQTLKIFLAERDRLNAMYAKAWKVRSALNRRYYQEVAQARAIVREIQRVVLVERAVALDPTTAETDQSATQAAANALVELELSELEVESSTRETIASLRHELTAAGSEIELDPRIITRSRKRMAMPIRN